MMARAASIAMRLHAVFAIPQAAPRLVGSSPGPQTKRRNGRSDGPLEMCRLAVYVIALASLVMAGSMPLAAQTLERPGLFRERCGNCHEGAGKLVKETLVVVEGVLRSRGSGSDVRGFLKHHLGGLSPQEAAIIYQVLLRIAERGGRFQQRCAICHVSAEELTRDKLIITDGVLRGRYTGRDIGEFLLSHGTSSPEEAAFFEGVLKRLGQPDR